MNLKVTLANGAELSPINIVSTTAGFQGASRRALEFIFSEDDYSIDDLKNAFTAANCETIRVEDTGIPGVNAQVTEHVGYVLFVGVKNESKVVDPGDEETPPKSARFNHVTIAKHTYEENRLSTLQKSIDQALLLALDAVD